MIFQLTQRGIWLVPCKTVEIDLVLVASNRMVKDYHCTDHVTHLVGNVLEPRLTTFRSRDHAGNFASDDGLGAEGLPECFTLVDPSERGSQHLLLLQITDMNTEG